MIDNSKEYILCAAIERKIPKDCEPYAYENSGTGNDITKIEIGYRHHDIYQRFGFDGENALCEFMGNQGFYTSKGRFVKRREAMKIAYECGQVTDVNRVFIVNNKIELNCSSYRDYYSGEKECEEIGFEEYAPLFSENLY